MRTHLLFLIISYLKRLIKIITITTTKFPFKVPAHTLNNVSPSPGKEVCHGAEH